MPFIDSVVLKERPSCQSLRIMLDEGEGFNKTIVAAMQEHKILNARVREIKGTVKELFVNYFEHAKFKSKKFYNQEIFRAHGTIRQSYGDLYGKIHVTIRERHPLTGTLVNAIAGRNTEIVLGFAENRPYAL